MKPTVDPHWVEMNIPVAWRAVQIECSRYLAASTRVDRLVDFTFWTMAMRRLTRIARAARELGIADVTAAVDAYETEVNVADLKWMRDWWEHADEVGAGTSRTKLRATQPFDVEGWTAAADRMQAAVRDAIGKVTGRP